MGSDLASPRKFGFLKEPIAGDMLGARFFPLPDHSERKAWIEDRVNRDGFYYPPMFATFEVDPKTRERIKEVEKSERPAAVFSLPSSHSIEISDPVCEPTESNRSDEAAIVNLLAFLYGTRLLSANLRFDSRIPYKSTHNIALYPEIALDFVKHAYGWWRSLTAELRTRFVNILFVYNRARAFEWEWDEFSHQYMVFDAIYHFYLNIKDGPRFAKNHRERFDILLDEYGIPSDDELVDKIYRTRNELFHEAMWGGVTIGFAGVNREVYTFPRHLRRLNARLLCGLCGYRNDYVGSVWWAMGTFGFGRAR